MAGYPQAVRKTNEKGTSLMLSKAKVLSDITNESMNGEFFFCDSRTENVSVMFCIDSFVDVNALNIKDSPCFKCLQGQTIREAFSGS